MRDGRKQTAQELAREASSAMQASNYAVAKELMLEAVSLRPDVVEYQVGVAMAALEQQEPETARAHWELALVLIAPQSDVDPEKVDDHVMILVALGREAEARSLIQDAYQKFSDSEAMQALYLNREEFITGLKESLRCPERR